jgi:hypothetical protein
VSNWAQQLGRSWGRAHDVVQTEKSFMRLGAAYKGVESVCSRCLSWSEVHYPTSPSTMDLSDMLLQHPSQVLSV